MPARTLLPEFLSISECVHRLALGMWGGVPRPVPVAEIKRIKPRLSVGFGPQLERAAKALRADAEAGRIAIFVRPRSLRRKWDRFELRRVPPAIVSRILSNRGGLPDHPTHLGRRDAPADSDDLIVEGLLPRGRLVVRTSDFIAWYELQRRKGRWPSQVGRVALGRGRPSSVGGSLEDTILYLAAGGAWHAGDGVSLLRRILLARYDRAPGTDALIRAVDRLFQRTGDVAFRRRARKPRGSSERPLARKSKRPSNFLGL